MKNVLFIGGTGYIGGPIMSRFIEREDDNLNISALVHSVEKAKKLRNHDLRLNVITGSHNDAELAERLAADSDVADCDDLQAAESILRGLKRRFEITGNKPVLIHMSGTGFLGDRAKGEFSSEVIYNDLDIAQIESLPATQYHRNVDLAIVEADKQGYTQTYIVVPGIVYGTPGGILAEIHVQNPTNFASVAYIKGSFARGAAGIVGKGKNIISHVDVTEVADLVEILYDSIESDSAGHGRNGYYFVANGDVEFGKVTEITELRVGPRRPFTDDELKTYFIAPGLQSFFGDNGRADAQRSRALGWKPVKTTADFLAAFREEVENWKN
ncbi:NmrA domain-containing protein [Mycena sanguinolenta]|uniref:NmrA domain-containing protein n=1 Tax=Mycena sanguinolenta TaxID=230812 RepID=A0A8H7CNT9_9AGAR|nr:NmrA domain-containing protein [Mycena sanguinolenta]